jgi:hypothetical protein
MLKKIIAGSLIGAGLIAGYSYFRKMSKTKAELLITPKASLFSLTLSGITIRVDLELKNPNAGTFTMRFPFVTLLYKGAIIGSSTVVNTEIDIPAYAEKTIEKIMVDVPLDSVFSVVSALLKSLQNKEGVIITVRTKTTVTMGLVSTDVIDERTLPLTN